MPLAGGADNGGIGRQAARREFLQGPARAWGRASLPLTLVRRLKEALGKLLVCGLAASPEKLAFAALALAPHGGASGYANEAGYQGLAAVSAGLILALAAPGDVALELDLGALSLG